MTSARDVFRPRGWRQWTLSTGFHYYAIISPTIVPMNLSPEEEEQFSSETQCYLCKRPLEDDKVRDHCHLSGRYRGAAHNSCNLQYKMRKMIPVVFHNLKNYDAHHIIKCFGNFKDHEFNILANNMEK
ncbi:uncharacterized protein NPIL_66571 [Nephila pilipes]|uniref:DNA-directed DNA polymerase n=1 Tax=Nephila pilipes TaxID=299642 RepID=A0A8X6Q1X6_NEPPI|nr:uncharacterized protein NPIL_66571 [Nephila pilipes]